LASQEINQLIVPFGKRTDITLSDGTHIWLNSGTQLDFPTVFTGKTREIHVYGEIFIDVAHNSKIPFIVRSKEIEIEVYGTSFNVSAYNDDNKKTVVLIDGKITIKTEGNDKIDLFPNEKIDIEEHKLLKEKVDVSEYISWTKGVLEFEQTPMSEILKKIGRYYNVRFDGSPDIALNEKSCSGKLFLSNNLDSVLTSVSVLSSTIYKRENNKIHIIKK
jgi:ferric-dicitrate binding protein FerR (iron transport regulator)